MKVDQVIWLFVVAVGLFVCVFAFVLITGQTFGQRCSALGLTGSQHTDCVQRLARGEKMP